MIGARFSRDGVKDVQRLGYSAPVSLDHFHPQLVQGHVVGIAV